MICGSCRAAFFSSTSWLKLREGIESDLLTKAQKRPQPAPVCTVCSIVLQGVKGALDAYLRRRAGGVDHDSLDSTIVNIGTGPNGSATESYATAKIEWPTLPVKVEKRGGRRLSFIIGSHHKAKFVVDNDVLEIEINAYFFILSPRSGKVTLSTMAK
jgi:hypothetical protein